MPTRSEYIDYVLSRRGFKRRHGRENDVDCNEWFYDHEVWGLNYAWCLVEECYCMNHFDILALNGGKASYVPNMPAIAKRVGAKVWNRPKRGSDAYKPGNRIGFDFNDSGEAEHTGTFWKGRDTQSFWSVDGNTGTDQVLAKVRYYSDVLFVVETLGLDGDTPEKKGNDDVPDYVSLTTKTGIAVKPDQEFYVKFDKEVSDTAKRHSDAGTEGIFVAGKNGSLYTCQVTLNGPATWELCEMQKDKDGEWHQHDHNSTGGIDLADAGSHLWLKVTPHQEGEVTVGVKAAIWDRD